MSEETRINPEHLTELLEFLALDVLDGIAGCMGKGWKKWVRREPSHKFKPGELAEVERAVNYIVMALQMGLLLAKRQTQLQDAALNMLKSGGVSPHEVWEPIIEEYHAFLRTTGQGDSAGGNISPGQFGEFLAFLASDQLMEMSQLMDDEWQKAWRKRENPSKLNPKENAKLAQVGRSAGFAIIIGLLIAKRQPELLMVDWSRGASLDTLWKGILRTHTEVLYYKHFVDGKPF
jgi:hypothetical protein